MTHRVTIVTLCHNCDTPGYPSIACVGGPVQYSICSTVQYSTVQYSTVQYLRVGVKLGVPELAEEQSLARAAANQGLVFTLWTNERRVFAPAAAHTDHHRGPGPSGDI